MSKYDTFWPRFWALFIDGIILNIIDKLMEQINFSGNQIGVLIITLISLNLPYVYSVWMHGKYGQTLGKIVFKIRIMDFKSEEKINYHQALMRDIVPIILVNLFFIASTIITWGVDFTTYSFTTFGYIIMFVPGFMLIIWSILEIITMLFNPKNRALHDLIAETVVIKY